MISLLHQNLVERVERLEDWLIGPGRVWYLFPLRMGGVLLLPIGMVGCSVLGLMARFSGGRRSEPELQAMPFHEDVIEADPETIEELKQAEGIVLLEFWAAWCAPCFTMKPAISRLAEESEGDFVIASIDATAHSELSRSYDVRGLPTLILLQDGDEIARHSGVLKFKQLRSFVYRHLEDL